MKFSNVFISVLFYSGACHSKPSLISGGRTFVWPGIQRVQKYGYLIFVDCEKCV